MNLVFYLLNRFIYLKQFYKPNNSLLLIQLLIQLLAHLQILKQLHDELHNQTDLILWGPGPGGLGLLVARGAQLGV